MKNKGILPVIVLAALTYVCGTTYMPPDIDHAAVLRSLNRATLEKGKQIYDKSCISCHGSNGNASLPQARSFSKDRLRFGNKPYDMWRTVTNGAGMMAAQTWLAPAERYYVIQYIREAFMKKNNPDQYYKITDEYLSKLPKSRTSSKELQTITKNEALKGSLKYGQEWFLHHQGNYGTAIHSQLRDHVTSALTVMLGNNVKLSYNLLRMGTTAVWQGKLNLSDTKYNRYRGEGQPFIEGKELDGLDMWRWTYENKLAWLEESTGSRSPLDPEYMEYHGHYANGKNTVLSYSIMGREILEFPEASDTDGWIILSQTLTVAPGKEQQAFIGHLTNGDKMTGKGVVSLINKRTNRSVSVGVIASDGQVRCVVDDSNRIILTIPASKSAITLRVLRTSGNAGKDPLSFQAYVQQLTTRKKMPALEQMIKGGAPQWTDKTKTHGDLNVTKAHFDPRFSEDQDKTSSTKLVPIPSDYPYTIDNIELPFDNAYHAWIRPVSLAFKSNGNLLIGTYAGDVWMATGIDSTLKNITWQRIAAGLFEPMGLKVVKDQIYVTCRNGIICLHDLNGDGETDFYENFHADHDVSAFFHAFNFGLETDSKGNFYYAKPGEYTDNKDPGNIIKVSPDGKRWKSIATGFRVDNGITITPDDRIFVSDNQGNWMPANKINLIEEGAFYGYVPNLLNNGWSPNGKKFSKDKIINDVISPDLVNVPDTFHPPALWIPQEFDNSPGGGVWSDKSWGPLGDQFIHTSYGTGWVYYFLPHKVGGVTQGALIALPFQMEAGIQRAAVNPIDKQIYTTGLTGWDDGVSVKYGVLSRVRYKGGEGHLIKDAEVVKGGIKLTFNFELDDVAAANVSNYDVVQWNYKWTSRYGSAHYSVVKPDKEGEDKLTVKEADLNDGQQSVVLNIPDIGPAQTVRVRFNVKGKDGMVVKNVAYLTIHKIPG